MQNRGPMPGSRPRTRQKRKTPAAQAPAGARRRERTATAWLSVGLVALTVAVFAPARHFSFVSWDDPLYLAENPVVRQGITPAGLAWALTSPGRFYWHPLTWLSHMLDVQVFGMDAGAHHVVNLALHAAGTLLLFLLLRRITGHAGRSALVAALFAVHPLHVESVAWVAERKDVLSGVFWMLTLGAYASYARTPSRAQYAALVACFALGLMSKPTLVTLPLVLLLLDVWPLDRIHPVAGTRPGPSPPQSPVALRGLLVEKIPLFTLAIAASAITFLTGFKTGAVQDLQTVPVTERLSNAIVSSVKYLGMALWPNGLAAFYPFRPIPTWQVVACLLVLAGVSYAAVRLRHRHPYLMVGWLWYLAALLPVIGLVQAGSQSMADRFTYLPLVGLLIAVTWGIGDLLAWLRVHRVAAGGLALAVLAAAAGAARVQAGYWKDSETLWQRAVDAVPNNDLAHANLGLVLRDAGRPEQALTHFVEALRIVETPDPRTGTGRGTPPPEYSALLHQQIGLLLGRQGHWKEAAAHLREVGRLRPGSGDAHHALAQALASDGRLEEAIRESREAVRLEPRRAEFHGDFASVLYRAGDLAGAMEQLREAIRLTHGPAPAGPAHPGAAKWHYNLAAMLNETGRTADAIRELEAVLAIEPAHAQALAALGGLRGKPPR
jgi:Tfp pilus assembly protein PilF